MLPAPQIDGNGPATERSTLPGDVDQRIVLYGVSYGRYVTLRELLDEQSRVHLTFRAGTLEIMSPSNTHEREKKMLARLIEQFAADRGLDLIALGSTTFRSEAAERGCEPDECYYLNEDGRNFPDFAIEVVTSRSAIDKLDVYRGLGLQEVWRLEGGRLTVYELDGGAYRVVERSRFLPGLDLALLAQMASSGDNQNEAAVS